MQHRLFLIFTICISAFALKGQVSLDTTKIKTYLKEAESYFNKFDFPQAAAQARLALDEFSEAPDTIMSLRAAVLHNLGGSLVSLGQAAEARSVMEEAIKIYESLVPVNYLSIAQMNSNIGISFIQSADRDFQAAIPWFQKAADAMQASEEPNKNLRTMDYLGNIGLAHFYLNQFELAEQKYLEALTFMEEPKGEDKTIVAMMEFRLGLLYQRKGNLSAALFQIENALENYTAVTTKHPLVGNIYRSLSIINRQRGDYENALLYAEQARVLFQELIGEETEEYISALDTKGDALESLGRWQEVNQLDSTILDLFAQKYTSPNASWLINIASQGMRSAEQKEDPNLAIEVLQQVLRQLKSLKEPVEEEIAQYTLELGLNYLKLKQPQLAEIHLLEALRLHEAIYPAHSGELIKPNASLARFYAQQGEKEQALKYFSIAEKAAGIDEQLSVNNMAYPVYNAKNLGEKANLYATGENPNDKAIADSLYQKGIELLEAIQQSAQSQNSKIGLQDEMIPMLEGRLALLWDRYEDHSDPDLAAKSFVLMERGKSFILLQAIQKSRVDQFYKLPDSLFEKKEKLKTDIAFYERELFELNRAAEASTEKQVQDWTAVLLNLKEQDKALNIKLEKEYPGYFQLLKQNQVPQLSKVQKDLNAKEALVEYFLGKEHIYLLKLSKSKTELLRFPTPSALAVQVRQIRQSLLNQDADFIEPAYQLYQSIIKPLGQLPEHLIIIPDAILSYLPFELLLVKEADPSKPNYKDLAYLLHQHHISYNFSASLWKSMKDKKYKNKGMLAIAPSFESSKLEIASRRDLLAPLVFNQSEVEHISKLFKANTLQESQATLDNFLELHSNYSLLHFASHAKIDEQFSDYSYLAFYSPEENQSSKLYLRDLYNLHLPLDMVTLSACETGIGQLQKGEGVISLARGFAFAGAKSIITSLWTANDLSTATLMLDFYEGLKSGQAKDQALRAAKLQFLEEQTLVHPYYWATFIPMGDMAPLSSRGGLWKIALGLGLAFIFLFFIINRFYPFSNSR